MTDSDCTYCTRAQLTSEQRESTPWPDNPVMCRFHRRVQAEIEEAREMEAG